MHTPRVPERRDRLRDGRVRECERRLWLLLGGASRRGGHERPCREPWLHAGHVGHAGSWLLLRPRRLPLCRCRGRLLLLLLALIVLLALTLLLLALLALPLPLLLPVLLPLLTGDGLAVGWCLLSSPLTLPTSGVGSLGTLIPGSLASGRSAVVLVALWCDGFAACSSLASLSTLAACWCLVSSLSAGLASFGSLVALGSLASVVSLGPLSISAMASAQAEAYQW